MNNTVQILNGQNIIDIAIQQYGDVEAVAALAFANEVDITSSLTVGATLELTTWEKPPYTLELPSIEEKTSTQHLVLNNQTLLDVALQLSGSVEGVVALMLANGVNAAAEDLANTKIDKGSIAIVDQTTYNFYQARQVVPATYTLIPVVPTGLGKFSTHFSNSFD